MIQESAGSAFATFVLLFACTACNSILLSAEPPVTALEFSPDGKAYVAATKAGIMVHRWPKDADTRQLNVSIDDVHDLAFSPNGRFLAVAGGTPSESGECEIIAWPSGRSLLRIRGQEDVIYGIGWSSDSTAIATGSMDTTVLVTRLNRSNTLSIASQETLTGHSKGVLCVAFLDGGSQLISAGVDQSIRVWSVQDRPAKMVRALENHTAAIRDLAIRPAPPDSLCVVASIGEDRSIRFWQPTIGRMMRFARLDSAIPLAARWLADGSRLAVACHDGHVRLIDPDTTEVVADHSMQTSWCYAIAIHPREHVLIAGGADGASSIARLPWTEPNQSTN